MKNTKKGNLGKALLMGTALVTLSSYDASATTGTGSMSAVILTPIVVAPQTPLHFGSMTVVGTDTVTITPDGAGGSRSIAGANVTGVGTTESEGVMRITAAQNVAMDVALVPAAYTVTGAGTPMVVDNFVFWDGAATGTSIVQTIPLTATFIDFEVGADLNVNFPQTPGLYTGTFQVDVNYQ